MPLYRRRQSILGPLLMCVRLQYSAHNRRVVFLSGEDKLGVCEERRLERHSFEAHTHTVKEMFVFYMDVLNCQRRVLMHEDET